MALTFTANAYIFFRSINLDLDALTWAELKENLDDYFPLADYTHSARDQLEIQSQTSGVSSYNNVFQCILVKCFEVSILKTLNYYVESLNPELKTLDFRA